MTTSPPASRPHRVSDTLLIWGPCVAVAVIGVLVVAMFIKPAPPRAVTIAGGTEGGAYAQFAQVYAEYLRANGIEATVLTTAGSIENARRLADGEADAGLIQGGSLPSDSPWRADLESVVAVFHEPLWLFVRVGVDAASLSDLAGKRVSIGPSGSGTAALARRVMAEGLGETSVQQVLQLSTSDAIAAMKADELDALFVVMAPTAPLIASLLADPAIRVVPFRQVRAYDRRSDSLTAVTLYAGSVDPARALPAEDMTLLASAASIVVRRDTHPAVVQLLVQAAVQTHRGGSLLHEPGTFPNTAMVDLPIDPEVAYYLERGPGWLQRTFPFWLASLIDRAVILAVPLMALLIPVFRGAPPLYRWRIRSRIYRWYRQLREIDERLHHTADQQTLRDDDQQLSQLENELLDVHVPLSYMEEFYHLRLHLDYVRRKLRAQLDHTTA